MSIGTIALVLFLIMDPIGNVTSFQSLVGGIEPRKQYKIIFREMLIALAVMIIFNFIGEWVFDYLAITELTVKISSGVILFLIALRILFPNDEGIRDNLPQVEPFIVPLAIPLIAGPSLLATIMLYARMEPSSATMFFAIMIAWSAAVVVLLSSRFLINLVGYNGLMAAEKLMGMVLILLAIQRFMDGVEQFVLMHR